MTEPARIWAIRPSSNREAKRFAPLFWEKGVAAIDYVGSSGAGDLHGYTLPELKEEVRRVKAKSGMSTDKGAVTNAANQLWRFANEIRVYDWILCPRPKPDDVMIGRCISAYECAPGRLDEYQFPVHNQDTPFVPPRLLPAGLPSLQDAGRVLLNLGEWR